MAESPTESSQTTSRPAYPAFGEFVKTQRALAQLSLRQASAIARISNPYLSQIEHGWVMPSVTVMSKLAEAFSVSAEAFLMEAAVAASGTATAAQPSTEQAIQRDARLSVDEKKALLLILESFVRTSPSSGQVRASESPEVASDAVTPRAPAAKRSTKKTAAKKTAAKKAAAKKPASAAGSASGAKRRPARASMSANLSSATQPRGSA